MSVRIGLETGPTTTWLWTELKRLGLPVICIDARHAKAVLKMQINKSDRNDAAGIARIMQTGWFKEVRVKDLDSHAVKALLASRALLVKIKRDLENQVRGLLKNLGLVIGRAKFNVFAVRAEELIEGRPELLAAVRPLLEARKAIEQQVDDLDRKVQNLARHDVHAAHVSVRSSRRTANPRAKMVGAQDLGSEAHQAKWATQGQGRCCAQARGHSAPHVGRRDRVQLVDKEGHRVGRIRRS